MSIESLIISVAITINSLGYVPINVPSYPKLSITLAPNQLPTLLKTYLLILHKIKADPVEIKNIEQLIRHYINNIPPPSPKTPKVPKSPVRRLDTDELCVLPTQEEVSKPA